MFEKFVVVDCSSHLLGRLASYLAKELLNGQKVVCVRTEDINVSGSLFRNRLIFEKWLGRHSNSNPKRGGPIHYRNPGRILWKVIRGMIPHKTKRGDAAMKRLTVVEGIPRPYDKLKRVVVPGALRLLRLKPNRKFCRLGDLSASIGWSYQELIRKLEDKRKVKSAAWYVKKKQHNALKAKAITSLKDKLKKLGKIHVSSKPPRPGPPGLHKQPGPGKSDSSKPKPTKPKADKPESKSADPKPKSDKPKSDKPKADKPPKTDKPKSADAAAAKPKKDAKPPKTQAATTAATSAST